MRRLASLPLFCAAAITFAPLPLAPSHAADWPHWRGPQRNGVSTESGWQSEWPADGPKVAWKANVGLGFSSVVVADGHVFTAGHAAEKDTVFALDLATGKEVWKYAYPAELGDKYFEGGTTGTPTVEGDRVYWLSRWGDLFCFATKDGAIRWQKKIQSDSGAREPDWGFSGAPLVQGDRLFLNAGESGLALDKLTGAVLWKSAGKEAGYSTPYPFQADGQALAVFSSGDAYTAVRLADGQRVWSTRWTTQYGVNASDPILHDGQLFLSTGYGKGAGLFKLGGAEPASVWKSKVLATQMNAAVLFNGHLYGADGDTTSKAALKCVEFATGKEKWSQPNFGSGGVIVVDGKLVAINGTGELLVAPATPEKFAPISRAQVVGGKTWTAPVLSNGRILCRGARGDVVCLDVRKG